MKAARTPSWGPGGLHRLMVYTGGVQLIEVVNPLGLPVSHQWPIPLNMYTDHAEPDDEAVSALAADMDERGWVGAPVVVWDDLAITGTHRIAAWKSIDADRVPCVDVADLLDAHGLVLDRASADEQYGPDYTTVELIAASVANLPDDIIDTYGLDQCP